MKGGNLEAHIVVFNHSSKLSQSRSLMSNEEQLSGGYIL